MLDQSGHVYLHSMWHSVAPWLQGYSCCFFARPGVSSVRPRLDVLTVRASCRLIARTLCVCDICALILPDMNAFVVLFALPFSAFQSQIRRGARDLKGGIIVF